MSEALHEHLPTTALDSSRANDTRDGTAHAFQRSSRSSDALREVRVDTREEKRRQSGQGARGMTTASVVGHRPLSYGTLLERALGTSFA